MEEKVNLADKKFCQAITLLCEVSNIIGEEFGYFGDEIREFDGLVNDLTDCELAKCCKFGM